MTIDSSSSTKFQSEQISIVSGTSKPTQYHDRGVVLDRLKFSGQYTNQGFPEVRPTGRKSALAMGENPKKAEGTKKLLPNSIAGVCIPQTPPPRTPFKAREIPRGEPFVPKKSPKPATVPIGFNLHSGPRSQERATYDTERAAREELHKEQRTVEEAKKMKQSEDDTRAALSKQQFKARKVPKGEPFKIRPSTRLPTTPKPFQLSSKTNKGRDSERGSAYVSPGIRYK